ncbi:MAG: hypothetical protein RIE77_06760 [Phycisphaerales bacterium]|jgi:hypothetical protein
MHVVMWVLVLVGTLAIIVAGAMKRSGDVEPGPSVSAEPAP